MTTQQMLTMVDDKYPNAESNTTKIQYFNSVLDELSPDYGDEVEDDSLSTVADTDAYALPSGINDISEIFSLAIANQTTPANRYDYTEYKKAYREQNPASEYSYFQIKNSAGAKKLVIYPIPTQTGLNIIIRYNKAIPNLSLTDLTEEPEIDSRFHDMLVYNCIHEVCSSGANPDGLQANFYMQKYESRKKDFLTFFARKDQRTKRFRRDNPQWHRYRSYGRGD